MNYFYSAPEIIFSGVSKISTKSDIFSFGMYFIKFFFFKWLKEFYMSYSLKRELSVVM